jgi:hypothetical protein
VPPHNSSHWLHSEHLQTRYVSHVNIYRQRVKQKQRQT